MSLIDNIDNVAFTTSLEVDKIFPEKFSGSFTVGASSSVPFNGNTESFTETNPYGEDVLPVMLFSTNETDWYEGGSMAFAAGASLNNSFSATCYTTSSSLVIIGQNFTGSQVTCYYKVVLVSDD